MDKFLTGPGIFTPDGHLNQIEYAMEAVENSNNLIFIKIKNGFVIGSELKNNNEIEDIKTYSKNIFLIDKHIIVGISGNIPDAQIIINHARNQARQYRFTYQEDIPINEIVNEICIIKQQFGQSKTSRPIGCSLIIAGWDRFSGLQLLKTNPSGTFSSWNAICLGSNGQTNQVILNEEYASENSASETLALIIRLIKKKASDLPLSRILDLYTCIVDSKKNILFYRVSKNELDLLGSSEKIQKDE